MVFFVSPAKAFNSPATRLPSAALSRGAVIGAVALALGAVFVAGRQDAADAVRAAGQDLTYLLRMMALLKAGMAAVLIAAIVWRLGAPVETLRLSAYVAACTAMAAGPAFIWSMAHVGLGALLLHGGLLAGVVLMWRDPATAARLSAAVAARRSRSR